MTEQDEILVRVLAHQDAIRLPVRDWSGHTNVNRYFARKEAGIPYRQNSGSNEVLRKAGEKGLTDAAAAGLLTILRQSRVKYPIVALTAKGDFRARALSGRPGRADGRLFLIAVHTLAAKYVSTISGRWCPRD